MLVTSITEKKGNRFVKSNDKTVRSSAPTRQILRKMRILKIRKSIALRLFEKHPRPGE
jgi:hypothetical protein